MKAIEEENVIQQVSIDCVIFGYQQQQLKVLVSKLNLKGDFWALPRGSIGQNEGIDEAARRILEERTGMKDIYLEQFRVFGDAGRSNNQFLQRLFNLNQERFSELGFTERDLEWFTKRFISIGYYALVDINKVTPSKTVLDASIDWYNLNDLPSMIIDHNQMVYTALETLRFYLNQKLNAFNLLPETFTMKEVQELYQTIFSEKNFTRNNFQKMILDLDVLERLEKKFTGGAHKAPYLYRFKRE